MKKIKLLLFVSSNCAFCPGAEHIVKKIVPEYRSRGLEFEKIRTKTNDGKKISLKYNIMGVPTTLMLDEEEKEIERIVGVPEEAKLRNKIEQSLGIKKSFLDKFLGN